jgi:hypothetical protein
MAPDAKDSSKDSTVEAFASTHRENPVHREHLVALMTTTRERFAMVCLTAEGYSCIKMMTVMRDK